MSLSGCFDVIWTSRFACQMWVGWEANECKHLCKFLYQIRSDELNLPCFKLRNFIKQVEQSGLIKPNRVHKKVEYLATLQQILSPLLSLMIEFVLIWPPGTIIILNELIKVLFQSDKDQRILDNEDVKSHAIIKIFIHVLQNIFLYS